MSCVSLGCWAHCYRFSWIFTVLRERLGIYMDGNIECYIECTGWEINVLFESETTLTD